MKVARATIQTRGPPIKICFIPEKGSSARGIAATNRNPVMAQINKIKLVVVAISYPIFLFINYFNARIIT